MAKLFSRPNSALFILSLSVMTVTVMAQAQLGGGVIQGIVRSKQVPLPGAIVTVSDTATSKTVTAITEVNGQFQLKVAGPGKYHINVDMTLFTAQSADVEITVGGENHTIDSVLDECGGGDVVSQLNTGRAICGAARSEALDGAEQQCLLVATCGWKHQAFRSGIHYDGDAIVRCQVVNQQLYGAF